MVADRAPGRGRTGGRSASGRHAICGPAGGRPRTCCDVGEEIVNLPMDSVIGPNLRVMGDLIGSGDIQIDGRVEGNVRGRSLVVGLDGRIDGRIFADAVEIHGAIHGRIVAMNVTMGSTARVVGKVFHNLLNVEPGAAHEGLKPWRPVDYFASRKKGSSALSNDEPE